MRLVYWVASLLLLGLLSLHTLPYVARDMIVYSLLQQGADEARLSRVSIDWLNAKVALRNLEVRHEDSSVIRLQRLDFDIYLKELLDDRLRLSGLRLEGAQLKLRQQDQLILLGPIVLAGGAAQAQETNSETVYQFGSDLIELVDLDVELLQPQGAQRLNIERLNIGGLYQWSPLESTDIRFVGHLNGAPITIDSSALPLPERKTVSVNIALRQLELTPLLTTLEPEIAASLDANLSIEVAVEGYNAWISQSGSLGLNTVDVRTDEAALQLASIVWQGEAQQQLDLSDGAQLLSELTVTGLLRAEGLQANERQQSASFKLIEAQPDLRFIPASQTLTGALGLNLSEVQLGSEQGQVAVTQLRLDAPEIRSNQPLSVAVDVQGFAADDNAASKIRVEQLNGNTVLNPDAGKPLWEPVSGATTINLAELQIDSPQLQAELGRLNLSADSSSLSQLENVELIATADKLALASSEMQGQLAQLSGKLDYAADQEHLVLSIDALEPDFEQADLGLHASLLSTAFNGRLPADLSELAANIRLNATDLKLQQGQGQYGVQRLDLSGPIKAALPTGSSGFGADSLESAALELNLEGFDANGELLSGTLNRLGLVGEYVSADDSLALTLDLGQLDLQSAGMTLSTEADTLNLAGSLSEDFSVLAGNLDLESSALKFRQDAVSVEWQAFNFSGPLQLPLTADLAAQPLSINGNLSLQQLGLTSGDQTNISLGQVSGDLSLEQQAQLAVSAGINLERLRYSDGEQQIQLGAARLDPQLTFAQTLSQLDPLNVVGTVAATLENLSRESGADTLSLAKLSTQMSLSSQGDAQKISGTVTASSIDVKQQALNASVNSVNLQPDLQRSSAGLSLSTPINLSQAAYQDAQQQALVDSLVTDLRLQLDQQNELSSLDLGATSLEQLSYAGDQPIKLDQARLQSFSIAGQQQFGVQQLELRQLLVGPTEAPMLALNRFELDRAEFANDFLQLGTLVTEDLIANLQTELKAAPAEINADKSASDKPVSAQTEAGSNAALKEKHLPVEVKLDGWTAQGRTELNYRDTSLVAPLNLKLIASQISAGAWDSRSGAALPLKLRAKLNDSADINLDANITPLLTKPNGDWKLTVSSLPMPILSPLVQSFAGYQIRSGSLNLESSGTLKAGQLKGNNAVRIQRLEVQRGQDNAANETDKMFTMPLPSAVSLLENDERVIKLDLPVSGDINDPKFNYQDVIQIVVTKGVKEGAMAYLTNSLQPFGAIFMVYNVVKDANDSGRFIQLQALEFDSAESALNQSGRDYAAKLAGMMQERPSLTLEICPVTTLSEEGILWDRLLEENKSVENPVPELDLGNLWSQRIAELAAARIESLRSALIRVGVENERIFPCIARAGVAEGVPRVELAF